MKHNDGARKSPIIACVTGASGMVGQCIVQKLLELGFQVRVLTRRNIFADARIKVTRAGLSDEIELDQFISGANMVFHCAAELSDTSSMWEVNVLGTDRLVKLIRKYKIEYFCYLSSAGVVGSNTQEWIDESVSCFPRTTYERTKLDAEAIASVKIEGCSTIILRPTNIVDQNHLGELSLVENGSIKNLLKAFIKGGECAHIVFADDVAEAAVYFVSRPWAEPRIFFVSIDDDPLNTVASLWSLYRHNVPSTKGNHHIRPLPHLPAVLPYMMRMIMMQPGNHGNVKYSSRRLVLEGFRFRFGVKEIVNRIFIDRTASAYRARIEKS